MTQSTTPAVPKHVGLILDGNRRWARAKNIPTLEGHRAGYQNIKTISRAAYERGVEIVTAFVFSTENWNRTKEEVAYLMKLLKWVLTHELDELHAEGRRVVWLGSKKELSKSIVQSIEKAEERTKNNTNGTLALCLNHGGHREISEAVQRIIVDKIPAEEVDEKLVESYIDHAEIPPIDLLVRTSGEQRLSNFMLWRVAYSEIIFRSEAWPDFTVDSLDECLIEYNKRQRRFGG